MALRKCVRCREEKTPASFIASNSIIHGGVLPICRQCLAKQIDIAYKNGEGWNVVDKICQWADVPFVPEYWEKVHTGHGREAFGTYVATMRGQPYDSLDWKQYNDVYLQIQEEGRVEDALPTIKESQLRHLKQKWGPQYDEQELEYLENLHQGMLNSQNIVGALNEDQALKLCKISLVIENKIRAGLDFDKDLRAYDNLSKLANFTAEVVKDGHEFSSVGELFAYLEKRGWKEEYYDGVVRDEADFTTKDIKYWLQYLYTNETGVAEEIEQRIQHLKTAGGDSFNEEEFRKYIAEQGSAPIEEEDFDPMLH